MSDLKNIALDYAAKLGPKNVDDLLASAAKIEAYLAGGEATAADKPKSTRAKKPDAEPAAAETAKEESKPTEPAKEETKPVETISRDDMLTAATLFTQKNGDQALIDTLDQMGASKFSEVPAERYAEFKALLDDYQPKGASALD